MSQEINTYSRSIQRISKVSYDKTKERLIKLDKQVKNFLFKLADKLEKKETSEPKDVQKGLYDV